MTSSIGGTRREVKDFTKKVGLFEGKVIAINPSTEEYKEVLGMELTDDSKATEYLGESKEGNVYLRVDVWLEEVKNKEKYRVSFFLEDKVRLNKDGNKTQYINAVGVCSWADDPNNLPEWFATREYREANVGEEELYDFLRTWLGNLDYRSAETTLQIEWKKLMKGNVSDLKAQIDGEWSVNIGAMATVVSREKDGEAKEYQNVYSKAFLPAYALKNFRLVDYSNPDVIAAIRAKKSKDQKAHEKFVVKILGEYGCKDFFVLKDIKEYDPKDNFAASDKVISEEGADY